MKLKNPYGKVAIEVNSVKSEGQVIVIKGEALGTMPITVNVTPEDVWEARHFLSFTLMRRVPVMFVKGWWRSRKHPTQTTQVGKTT
jgi:hypothetical protein